MRTKLSVHRLVVLAAVAAIALVVSSSPAQAAGPRDVQEPSPALSSLLDLYPGSTVVSESTIQIAPGVSLTLPKDFPRNKRVERAQSNTSQITGLPKTLPAPPAKRNSGTKPAAEPAAAALAASGTDCPEWHLCIYSEQYFYGFRLDFYYCNIVYNLGNIPFPTGGMWNDKLSSWYNNQSWGTYSVFWNWNGYWWVQIDDDYAKSAFLNPSYNDLIDGLWAC